MELHHLAIVSSVDREVLPLAEIARVAAAIQKQVLRDFAPIWGVEATVDLFAALDEVPDGWWPLIVHDDGGSSPGSHIANHGHPIAYVAHGPTWSLTASHEALEMLSDPTGMKLVAGDSPTARPDRVEFLVEICDPCQDAANAYLIDGVLVSDFYTPAYFEPLFSTGGTYSFRGRLREPREVLPGGYLTWRSTTTGSWSQLRHEGGALALTDLGPSPAGATGLRAWVDERAGGKRHLSHVAVDHEQRVAARAWAAHDRERAAARAPTVRADAGGGALSRW
jgi:hypothetical protein